MGRCKASSVVAVQLTEMFITKKFFSDEKDCLIFNLNFKPYDRFGGGKFRLGESNHFSLQRIEALRFAKKTV